MLFRSKVNRILRKVEAFIVLDKIRDIEDDIKYNRSEYNKEKQKELKNLKRAKDLLPSLTAAEKSELGWVLH